MQEKEIHYPTDAKRDDRTRERLVKRYGFSCKVSVATTSRGSWVVGALAFAGNPYDSHTLGR